MPTRLLALALLMIASTGLSACTRTMSYDEATGKQEIKDTQDWQYQKLSDRNNHGN